MNFFPGNIAQDAAAQRADKYIERFVRRPLELHFDAYGLAIGVGNRVCDRASFYGLPLRRRNKTRSIGPNIKCIVGGGVWVVIEGNGRDNEILIFHARESGTEDPPCQRLQPKSGEKTG
jgi:hypothetical protein